MGGEVQHELEADGGHHGIAHPLEVADVDQPTERDHARHAVCEPGRRAHDRGPTAGDAIRTGQEEERDEDQAEQAPLRQSGPAHEADGLRKRQLVEDRQVLDDVGDAGHDRDHRDTRIQREARGPPQPDIGDDEREVHERLVVELRPHRRPVAAEDSLDVARRAHLDRERDVADPARRERLAPGAEGVGGETADDDRKDEEHVGAPSKSHRLHRMLHAASPSTGTCPEGSRSCEGTSMRWILVDPRRCSSDRQPRLGSGARVGDVRVRGDPRDTRARRQAGQCAGHRRCAAARRAGGDRRPRAVSDVHALREGEPCAEPGGVRRRLELSAAVVRAAAGAGPPLRDSHHRVGIPRRRPPASLGFRLAPRGRRALRSESRRGQGLGQQRALGSAAGRSSERATDVRYCVFTDPAGALPKWLVGLANTEGIPKLFAAVSAAAASPRYASLPPPLEEGPVAERPSLGDCADTTLPVR